MNYIHKTNTYEVIDTGERRTREFFAWFPVWIGMDSLIPLRGSRFTWLKRVLLYEKKQQYRTLKFNDGWSYQNYWSEWKDQWTIHDIDRTCFNCKHNDAKAAKAMFFRYYCTAMDCPADGNYKCKYKTIKNNYG